MAGTWGGPDVLRIFFISINYKELFFKQYKYRELSNLTCSGKHQVPFIGSVLCFTSGMDEKYRERAYTDR